ncbi:hypothetical protein N7510_007569 [Penicillium lagena]|uniref:uncharacterized protein n=1 Tax=Penicillium lagena TaxID=94218 RepID=UPI00253FAE5A|nr:uncharacterized protein N7510_007569 [Penicillium lagena]KAJ5610850.1 hypothetical protein N7510_007569 [Penicillium lagena]
MQRPICRTRKRVGDWLTTWGKLSNYTFRGATQRNGAVWAWQIQDPYMPCELFAENHTAKTRAYSRLWLSPRADFSTQLWQWNRGTVQRVYFREWKEPNCNVRYLLCLDRRTS